MKPYLHTLVAAAAFLIQTTYVQGQYTYQTAVRFANVILSTIPTDSNATLPPGIQTGCATITTQPVWVTLGFCSDASMSLVFDHSASSPADMSIVIYGPFADTVNLGSKLTNANIDTCYNALGGWNWIYNIPSYQRGDIYIILMMSTPSANYVRINQQTVIWTEFDSLYCPFCNSRLSELYQRVCTVTYDSASQKNKIIWTKDIFTPAQDYVIFRKNASGTFDTLAYQSISQLSEFVDMTSTPVAKSDIYKVGIRDSCGQIMQKDHIGNTPSQSFTTMHLSVYPAGNNTTNLSWNKGSFNGPFLIYRTDPSGITKLIDSVGATTDPQTYTDINAPAGLCSYQVGVNFNPPCVSSLLPSYNIVKSNPGYVTVTGINELADLSKAISIEPNPFNQFTKIDLHLFTKQNLKVILRNLTGEVVMQFDDVKTDELVLDRNNLSQGLYFLEVTGKDFYARKKLVVD